MQYLLPNNLCSCYTVGMTIDVGRLRTRVEVLIGERGTSARAVSLGIGKSEAYIQQFISGLRGKKVPGQDVLEAIAAYFDMSVEELVAPARIGASPVPRRPLTDDELLDKIGARPYDSLDRIEGLAASAGPGSGIPQDIDDTIPRRRRNKRFDRLKEIDVIGRCMEPELYPGDVVIIDRERAPVTGKIVVAVRDEEDLLIKRFVVRDGVECLVSNDGQEVAVDERVRLLGPAVAYQRGLW